MPSRAPRPPRLSGRAGSLALAATVAAGAQAVAVPPATAAVVGPDVVSTVEGRGVAAPGGTAEFVVRTRNVGTATTTAPLVLALLGRGAAAQDVTGWTCAVDAEQPDDRTCALAGSLAAGEAAPDLTVRVPVTDASSAGATLTAAVRSGGGTTYAPASASVPVVPSSRVDVGLTATAAPARRTGERRYVLQVQNGPDAATSAPLTVALQRGVGDPPLTTLRGRRWDCDLAAARCVHPGALPAGAAAPPIDARTTRAEQPEAWEDPAVDAIDARLTGGGAPRPTARPPPRRPRPRRTST